jgi:hypothetical protein
MPKTLREKGGQALWTKMQSTEKAGKGRVAKKRMMKKTGPLGIIDRMYWMRKGYWRGIGMGPIYREVRWARVWL